MENEHEQNLDTMNCDLSNETEAGLSSSGWVETWSFHENIPEQWNEACRKVNSFSSMDGYRVALVTPDDTSQAKDGIKLIYIKRPLCE